MKSLRHAFAGSASAALGAALAFAQPAAADTIVIGGYPDQVQFIDDTSGKVTDLVTLETGLPDNLQLSQDRSKLYVTTLTHTGIEVIDTKTRKVLNHFELNTPSTRYRFKGGVPDPTGRYFYAIGQRFDKEVDLFRVSKFQYYTIDLKSGDVVRAVDFAEEDNGPGWAASMAISPDGKTLYVFGDKVRVLDTKDFSVLDRIDLAKPQSSALQDVSFGGTLNSRQDPGTYVSLFNGEDPYIHNKVFGIARFDLTQRSFTFDPIGPAPDRLEGLQVTPDGKEGYTVAVMDDLGDQRCEFWHFDLETNTAVGKAEFECRRRFYFAMSADGKKLYIYGAGYDIAVYDAATLKLEADWEVRNDITMAGLLHLP
ncbi:YncE family protein [Novosphingobium sp. BW1]|uniref:YncE family protein n=1 Tax=Novosphingobium sp. BW1 TaxID=2592621 RepID=UPI0011DEB1E9|nr:hypothetical protein [Novosphingobium sp. BW1]TYC87001.1 hypothetical protein FMM79_14230 [Novosphingobium sp. BW1]